MNIEVILKQQGMNQTLQTAKNPLCSVKKLTKTAFNGVYVIGDLI